MATNKARYTVSVDDELFQKIENFRFENRYPTRSEATVELIRLGLEELKRRGVLKDDMDEVDDPAQSLKSVKEQMRAAMANESDETAQK